MLWFTVYSCQPGLSTERPKAEDADEVFRRTLTEVLIGDADINHGDAHEYALKVLADVKKVAWGDAGDGVSDL